ncbi:MAG: hypothetical protein AAGE52_18655 [Myxococcota bacterium]
MKRSTKQKVLDTVVQGVSLYAAAKLLPFAIDKLASDPNAVAGFRQLGAGLGVDPTMFRYFVGGQELLVSIGLIAAAFAFLGGRVPRLERLARLGAFLGGAGLVATMGGAIATEYIVRPGQQQWLVTLAIQLLVLGAVVAGWSVVRFKKRRTPAPTGVVAMAR